MYTQLPDYHHDNTDRCFTLVSALLSCTIPGENSCIIAVIDVERMQLFVYVRGKSDASLIIFINWNIVFYQFEFVAIRCPSVSWSVFKYHYHIDISDLDYVMS